MIDPKAFATGLARLGIAFGREITEELTEVYAGALNALDSIEWQRAVEMALKNEERFPVIATLLRYARPILPATARAAEVYDEIVESYELGPEKKLGRRKIEERWGRPALAAFLAAGAERAFEWCEPDDEPFRLNRFEKAWAEAESIEGRSEARGEITAAEAKALLGGGFRKMEMP